MHVPVHLTKEQKRKTRTKTNWTIMRNRAEAYKNNTYKMSAIGAETYGKPKPLDQTKPGECRWPTGEGKDMLCCCAEQKPGSSYCEKHYEIAISERIPWFK